jgi:hypothetical protein
MSSKFSENVEAQIVGTIIGGSVLLAPAAIFAGAMPFLTAVLGERTTYLTELSLGTITLLFTLVAAHYYFLVLPGGNEPIGSLERKRFDDLKIDLARGGTPARIYSEGLTKTLCTVEKFFGDAGKTNGPRVGAFFGLQKARPLWTAPAFDRCILLALIYPIVTIFLVWVISGHVGPAEAALALPFDPGWRRFACLFTSFMSGVFYWQFQKSTAWKNSAFWFLLILISISCLCFAIAFAPDDAGAVAGSVAFGAACLGAITGDLVLAGIAATAGIAVGTFSFFFVGAFFAATLAAVTIGATGKCSQLVGKNNHVSRRERRNGPVLLFIWAAVIIVVTGSAEVVSSSKFWPIIGPLFLFFGLLSLLNAPFAWFSLGLTRALLWRGLEREKWWPYFYALVDAVLAALVIVFSAIVMIAGIQIFDVLAVIGGGKPILPLVPLFNGIALNSGAPEYWWVYALLLSTMIPSLINLTIGGLSLTRGIPWLSAHLHHLLHSNANISEFYRAQIAGLLASQIVVGVALGIAAQSALAFVLFRYAMPFFGVGLLEMARAIAAYNLPERLLEVFH